MGLFEAFIRLSRPLSRTTEHVARAQVVRGWCFLPAAVEGRLVQGLLGMMGTREASSYLWPFSQERGRQVGAFVAIQVKVTMKEELRMTLLRLA